jgi:anti-anti-sigma factor
MPSYTKLQDKLTVSFSGSLDTSTCIDIEEDLFKQIEESPGVVVFDLKEVTNISSMFLRICTKTVQKINKANLTIINVTEPAMKVFKLTKLDSLLNVSELS